MDMAKRVGRSIGWGGHRGHAPKRRFSASIMRPLAALALAFLIGGLLPACGEPAAGDVEGQALGLVKATEQPVILKGATAVVAGSRVDCGRRSDRCVAHTDDSGRYRFEDLPAGDYGVAVTYPGTDLGVALQPESRQVNVSGNQVETVSVVLLAQGIERPTAPPPAERYGGRASGGFASGQGPGYGPTSDPFFWYFLFTFPHVYGYPRPPVVVYTPSPDAGRTVVIDRQQPQVPRPGRTYTSYGSPSEAGRAAALKPPPTVLDSKGVTRPGGTAVQPRSPAPAAPVPGSAGSAASGGSKGESRPGLGSSSSASGPPAAATGSQPSTPPRVSSGSGSSAASGSSSGSPPRISAPSRAPAPRVSSPPRVRVGRR